MAITYAKQFAPQQLGTAAATLFSIAASPSTNLLRGGRIRFTNTTAGAVQVTAYAVPSAGTAADSNAFLKAKTIAANDFLDVDLPALAAGDFVQAFASAATSITAHFITGSVFA